MTMLMDVRDLTVRFALPKPSLFAKPPVLEAVRLTPAADGQVLFDGDDLLTLSDEEMRKKRRDVQLIFQDPCSSLNPRARVVDIFREPMDLMEIVTPAERLDRVKELFSLVGLRPDQLNLFPHQFSGGKGSGSPSRAH